MVKKYIPDIDLTFPNPKKYSASAGRDLDASEVVPWKWNVGMVAKLTSRNGWDKLPEKAADADCFLFLLIMSRAFWRQNMANIDNNGYVG